MTRRERVLGSIRFTGVDRIPFITYAFPGAFQRHGQALVDLLNEFPDDFGNTQVYVPDQVEEATDEIVEFRDEWGTLWATRKDYTAGEPIEPAIPDWSCWLEYQFPPEEDEAYYENLKRRVKEKKDQDYIFGASFNYFQHMQHLRGPANLLIDLAEDRPELHELADRLVERYNRVNMRCVEVGADCCGIGDDWGSQRALLIHPDMWRKFFKERYRRIFQPLREAGCDVVFHSDGWILEILDDLIEIGVNIINPQHHIMGNTKVGELIGGRVCVRSDLDRQYIIPHGTRNEIREHVKEVIRAFGRFDGGLILHGEIGPEVPLENIRALYEAYFEFGTYPLTWL